MDLTFASLYMLREEMADVTSRIAKVASARDGIVAQPRHADEIAHQFRRGLDAMTQDYEARLALFFTGPRNADVTQLLTDGAALYYMRDLVASKVPALIKRLSPGAERAIPFAERQAALRAANGDLARLVERHADLLRAFGAEKVKLRDMRQPSNLSRGDVGRQERAAIEGEEMRLAGEMDVMRADQHRFALLRAGVPHG